MGERYKNMRCGLIGERLGHSFSPMIHAELADYIYDKIELAPSELSTFVKEGGYDAFNVTIPYKKAVIPLLDRISPEAQRIGAVNTVVRRADGTLDGYNTDYFGFDGMLTASGIDPKGKKAIILGSGGASLTALAVLRDRGVGNAVVISRSGENNYENLHLHYDADIIVNTTPVGMYPNNLQSPIELDRFTSCRVVLDVIYNPARTALLLDAERLGIPYMNGLYMLVAQAVRAYEFFTGDVAENGIIEKITEKISAMTQNIILIGMPSCGKSTVGKLLARKLGREFFDADAEFEVMHGISPATAIQTLGEDDFREMEYRVLVQLGKRSAAVIACGGGAVTREKNYAPLHQNGAIIYLERELSKLSTKGRPLSQSNSLEALYEARRDAYERFADIKIASTEIPDKTADAMISALQAKNTRSK